MSVRSATSGHISCRAMDVAPLYSCSAQGWERTWHSDARCRGLPAIVFYPPDNERGGQRRRREQRAKCICRECPVIVDCLKHALAWPEPYGVWGATTPAEREKILSARLAADPLRKV